MTESNDKYKNQFRTLGKTTKKEKYYLSDKADKREWKATIKHENLGTDKENSLILTIIKNTGIENDYTELEKINFELRPHEVKECIRMMDWWYNTYECQKEVLENDLKQLEKDVKYKKRELDSLENLRE